ncbi:MAG: hypothetical protein A3B04_00345 [Candidatus Portnoybacteria bacterium RIFCSPLOWO2_02_FULL_39_11]|uniref:DUF3800 domain-containing protein n=1 Tax=Candidatus Portnoybacteria bacterium RIFCSPLOWO2_02_FULL_39_11 TaxID=1802001 RepID=A0A1G2FR32_9BACT|nr:MAG: hypothetical protein A3B04_00345 [Candidatus Portnoybacteria bacterium RIFCSPLOWO2_02_FULL_39_11]
MITGKKFKDIKTCFCFFDETGLLHSGRDKFFALGLIKCDNPQKLYNKIRKIRHRYNYNEEMKWTSLDRRIRFDVARECFNVFLDEEAKFNCIILNKDELDFAKYYDDDLYKVYRNFSVTLLKLIIGKNPEEVMILLMDDYFAPDGINLETTIKKFVNDHYQKFVIAGVCQIDSKASDLLQLTDLVLGAIIYDLKKQEGLLLPHQNVYKRKFLNFIYQKLNINGTFFKNRFGFRTRNYVLSGDKIRATIFDCRRSVAKRFIDKIKNKPWPTTGDACF